MISSQESGAGPPSASFFSGAFSRVQRASAASHSPGSSLMTARRARVSSPRLWSCVAVASSASGRCLRRSRIVAWNATGDSANCDGSVPTSLREISRP